MTNLNIESYMDLDVNKNMHFIERLISEVANTPLLWNRYHNDYNNRGAMDNEWERIAKILDKDKDFVKQKWRNLRDQFQREIKKVKVPFDNPTKPYIEYYRGKWIYFGHMLFLKEIHLKNRSNMSYSPSQDIEIHEDDILKEELVVFEDSDDMYAEQTSLDCTELEEDSQGSASDVQDSQNVNYNILVQPKIEVLDEVQSENNGVKRKATETNLQSLVPSKVRKQAVADASSNTEHHEEIDDDLHFVKSLVPYLRKLTPIRKLLVRNEIQNLLIRETLCKNCKFGKIPSQNS